MNNNKQILYNITYCGRMYRLGEVNVTSDKNRNPTNVRNQCRGEPCVRPLTETEIKPMSDGEVKP